MAFLRLVLIVLLARPIALSLTGADVVWRERLPTKGPAIVVTSLPSRDQKPGLGGAMSLALPTAVFAAWAALANC